MSPSRITATRAQIGLLKAVKDLAVTWADFELGGALVDLIARCDESNPVGRRSRCVSCGSDFDTAMLAAVGVDKCPSCGTRSLPCDPAYDLFVALNWHELRILAQWASNYAEGLEDHHKVTLTAILRRIDAQRPQGALVLTLVQEIKELQRSLPGAMLIDGHGDVVVPPKDPKGGLS